MSDVVGLVEALTARPSVTPTDGGCQSMIAARLVHPHLAGAVAMLVTSDEDGPSTDGTLRVVSACIHEINECVRTADIEPLKSSHRRNLESLLA